MNNEERVKNYYSNVARTYDLKYIPPSEEDVLKELIDQNYPKQILDIGTGTGRILFELAELGFTGKGIDISGRMIEIANEKLKNRNLEGKIAFEEANILHYNDDSKYGAVTAIGIFEYINDFSPYFKKIESFLPRGGIFVFTVQNKISIFSLNYHILIYLSNAMNKIKSLLPLERNIKKQEIYTYDIAWHQLGEIKQKLESNYFKIECVIPMRKKNRFPKNLSFSYKLMLIKARKR